MAKNTKRVCNLLLRVIAFASTLTASIIMATSHERVDFYGVSSIEAKYSNTPAFKYFVIANAIVSVYGFFVMFLPQKSLLWQLVVALDMVFTVLVASSLSAALAIAHVGKKGNSAAGWLPICGQVHNYCNQVTGALAAGFLGLVVYTLLVLYAIHTVLNPLLMQKN